MQTRQRPTRLPRRQAGEGAGNRPRLDQLSSSRLMAGRARVWPALSRFVRESALEGPITVLTGIARALLIAGSRRGF